MIIRNRTTIRTLKASTLNNRGYERSVYPRIAICYKEMHPERVPLSAPAAATPSGS